MRLGITPASYSASPNTAYDAQLNADSIQFIRGSWDSNADPAIPPERRNVGDITHSVALINACKPWHWREEFAVSNTPSPELARKAREKFGWLLDGNGRA